MLRARKPVVDKRKQPKSLLSRRGPAARLHNEVLKDVPAEARYSAAVVLELATARARRDRSEPTKTELKAKAVKLARNRRRKAREAKQAIRDKLKEDRRARGVDFRGTPVQEKQTPGPGSLVWVVTSLPDAFVRLAVLSEARENPLFVGVSEARFERCIRYAVTEGWWIRVGSGYRITAEGRQGRAFLQWALARSVCLDWRMPVLGPSTVRPLGYVKHWIRGEGWPERRTKRPESGYGPEDPEAEAWPDFVGGP
jgi:hypothetical protein